MNEKIMKKLIKMNEKLMKKLTKKNEKIVINYLNNDKYMKE